MLLLLADLVFQVPPARRAIHHALLGKGYTCESAYLLCHSCLRWWSFKVASGYLALAGDFWIAKTLLPGVWPLSLAFAVAVIMALISALRLLPVRDEVYEESDW